MIYIYELEPEDDVMNFTLEKFLEYMGEDKVWTFRKLSAYDIYHSDLLDFKDKPRKEFMVYDSDTGKMRYMWLEFGLRVLKEMDILKVSEEKLIKFREQEGD